MKKWLKYRVLIIEIFVLANLGFLALDIYIAHSTNKFHHAAEWAPFFFSLLAPVLLAVELLQNKSNEGPRKNFLGFLVGYSSIIMGLVGMLFHLNSQFFAEQTIKSLVYTAPFIAPLAYAGLGFLLLLNRMVDDEKLEWGQWLVFLAFAGFLGNFILSLCDHAQNGYFRWTEWIPVISGAFAVGFLATILLAKCGKKFYDICLKLMFIQILVGVIGFYFHVMAVSHGKAPDIFENIVYSAPVFAPLLFAVLAVLAGFGLTDLKTKLSE